MEEDSHWKLIFLISAFLFLAFPQGGSHQQLGALLRHSQDPPPPPFSRLLDVPESNYTSFSCTGGSQTFGGKKFHVYTDNYRSPEWIGHRLCQLRSVCVVDGALTFYVDPSVESSVPTSMRLSSFVEGLVYKGPYEATIGKAEVPRVVHGPRPSTLPFAPPGRLYLLTSLNNAQNYAHVLLDTIFPAFSVANFLGLGGGVEAVQHAGLDTCDTFPNNAWVIKGSQGVSFSAACWGNMDRWYNVIMPHPFLNAATGKVAENGDSAGGGGGGGGGGGVCYRSAVVGQESMFSSALFGGHMSRAQAARGIRARAFAHFGMAPPVSLRQAASLALAPPSPPPPTLRRVLVLEIFRPIPAGIANLCNLTHSALGGEVGVQVQCIVPGAMDLKEQLLALAPASLVVCEHGSTAYAGLFLTPGASMVVLFERGAPAIKEAHVLLFLPDISVLYLGEESMGEEYTGTLKLALSRVAP
jgi:hypothetical protein